MSAFAEIYSKEVSKEKLELYAMLLKDTPIDQLERALPLCARTCNQFPTVADILKSINTQIKAEEHFKAEKQWQVFKQMFGCWHPDLGLSPNAPELDAAGEYALRQIGGLKRFAASELAHENFIRKEFIEAYERFHETGGMLAPTRQEAAKLLDKLSKGESSE